MNRLLFPLAGLTLFALACGPRVGGGTGGTSSVTDDITADTTWSPSSSACSVTVQQVVNVKAALTVMPGTTVCFAAGAGLVVQATGSLDASGTAQKHVKFTGVEAAKGYWKGLGFLSVSSKNHLLYADVSGGGSAALCCGFLVGSEDAVGAVVLGDYATSAHVTIQNSTVSSSGAYGVFAFDLASLDGFASNSFSDNGKAGVSLFMTQMGQLDTSSVYGGTAGKPNGQTSVRVLAGAALSASTTVKKLDVPYGMGLGVAGSLFKVDAALTVEAGVHMEFEANGGILVEQTGRLTATGAAGNRVTFTGRDPTPGFWKGLAFLSLSNALAQVDVSYGGNSDAFCCGFFEPTAGSPLTRANIVVGDYQTQASVTLTDVTSTSSAGRGVSALDTSAVTQVGTNDLVTGNVTINLGI